MPGDLKSKVISSGIARLVNQGVILLLRLGYLAILARLLGPNDFGLVAMVGVITGVFDLFTSAGLSSATIQKETITNQQISTLFWINIMVGVALALLCAGSASFIATFYQEPRLFWIAVAMAPGFLFNAAGVQHSALLQRELRYVSLSVIDTASQCASIVVGVALALNGDGYWALVVSGVLTPAGNTICCWVATRWVPERPRKGSGVRSMLHFGGTVTLNGLVVYAGYNMEKVLLGRFWGADVLGLYSRAYQIANIPVVSLNSAIGGVMFSALSRLQGDRARVRSFFLKGYSILMAVVIPVTIFSALSADDIIAIILGPKWTDAATIFRLLTPTILVFSIINPTYWLLLSVGMQKRSLYIAYAIAPLVAVAYCIGLSYGPAGVALSYSMALILGLYPLLVWALHGTPVSMKDVWDAIAGPFLAGLLAGIFAFGVHQRLEHLSPLLRFVLGGMAMAAMYGWMLFFVIGRRKSYRDLVIGLLRPSAM